MCNDEWDGQKWEIVVFENKWIDTAEKTFLETWIQKIQKYCTNFRHEAPTFSWLNTMKNGIYVYQK